MDHQGDYVERVTDETPEHQPDAERAAQQEAADAGQGDPPAPLGTAEHDEDPPL